MSRPILTNYTVTTEYDIPGTIRIAHVSDLHERHCEDILPLLEQARPDIICVTGDTYERYDNRPQYDFYRRPIKRAILNAVHYTNFLLRKLESSDNKAKTKYSDSFLRAAAKLAPVYMSLGNHEQKLKERDIRFLEKTGIILLDNSYVRASVNGFEMLIGGMSSWEYEDFLADYLSQSGFKLLLCHQPERFEKCIVDSDTELMLSGHTHGGQFRIGRKGRGFFVPGQGVLGRYAHGQFFGGRLIVSSGCSNTVACPRVFNPRELVLVELKKR